MHRLNRLNQKPRHAQRLPEPSGHCPYQDRPAPQPWEPGWQPPRIDPAVETEAVLAHVIAYHAKARLEEQAKIALAELSEPAKKRGTVGKAGVPPEAL